MSEPVIELILYVSPTSAVCLKVRFRVRMFGKVSIPAML